MLTFIAHISHNFIWKYPFLFLKTSRGPVTRSCSLVPRSRAPGPALSRHWWNSRLVFVPPQEHMPVIESFYVIWCYSAYFGWLPSPCSSLEYHRWGWALLMWLLMGNNTKAGLYGNGVGGGITHISSAEVVQRTVWLLPGWPSFCSSYQFPITAFVFALWASPESMETFFFSLSLLKVSFCASGWGARCPVVCLL